MLSASLNKTFPSFLPICVCLIFSLIFQGSSTHLKEKTMMMIGATGSGKSTLIDGMVNHLLGVKWEDDFRFKIIDLTTDEEEKIGRQVCRLVQ